MASKQTAFFGVGEIRPAEDSDFEHFIELADGAGWTKKTDKNGLMVWTRNMENTSIKMFKVCVYAKMRAQLNNHVGMLFSCVY